ncbi:MAG: hypothetical protein ACI9MR_003387 [Myxococcota bacterium]|jgi:hypothetical protein
MKATASMPTQRSSSTSAPNRPASRVYRVLGMAVVFLAAFSVSGSALADDWKDNRGDCDKTAFKAPANTDLAKVAKCVKLFSAYQDVDKVEGSYKARVVAAMKRMYVQGSERDAKIAKIALKRLGVRSLPDRLAADSGAKKVTKKKPTKRKKARKAFQPPSPSKGQIKSAKKYFKRGFKDYRKKKYGKALKNYLKMTDVAPGYAKGHYNVACVYALEDDDANMAKYLQNLADLGANGDAAALEMLKLTRNDEDFAGVRDKSTEFKRITGYARIRIQNSLGELGEDNVDNLQASLKKLGHEVTEISPTKKKWKHPVVWYAAHAKGVAYIATKLLNHPDTKTKQLSVKQLKGYDLIIAWGDVVKDEDPKEWISDPADAEKKIDDLARKQDELLSAPSDAVDEVEDVLSTPDKVTGKADETVEKGEDAVKKVGDTIDKATGLFD